jgi:hypothetical protein
LKFNQYSIITLLFSRLIGEGIVKLERVVGGIPTLWVHNFPGDYYRFSIQAFKDVIFEGMKDVKVYSILIPPRIIGIGYNVK